MCNTRLIVVCQLAVVFASLILRFAVFGQKEKFYFTFLVLVFVVCFFLPRGAFGAGGTLLWEDQVATPGDAEAVAVATNTQQVFTAGLSTNSTGDYDFLVRAYDAGAGTLLWEDLLNRGRTDSATDITADKGRVFASGYVTVSSRIPHDPDFLVRAYDAQTGSLLWEDQFDQAHNDDVALTIISAKERVFAAGTSVSAAHNSDFLVRAYNVRTGTLLWQDLFDEPGRDDLAVAVATTEGRVFAAGFAQKSGVGGDYAFLVRAYDDRTGNLLWEDQSKRGGSSVNGATAVTAAKGQVFAAGAGVNAKGVFDFLVRAYDARTGVLLWEDQVNKGGVDGEALTIAAAGGRVFAAGFAQNSKGINDFLLRTYEARTGTLLWEDQINKGGVYNGASAVTVAGSQVFVSGYETNTNGVTNFVVRAYDAHTGALAWEDQVNKEGTFAQALSVAAGGQWVFAAGFAQDSRNIDDLLVRAYDAK